MVLVGPSGCGKTTALRMLAGLEEITDGEIRIGERVVNDLTPKDRDIAMVFQSYALYPHMTVEQNLAFGLKLRKLPKQEINERVRRVAKILKIEEFLKRKPRALSGGQRQRVAMGRAIVREPQAFLMDEPLSNLDAKLRVTLRAEIHQLQRSLGVTTIYVTHDQVEAMTMGDRVAVMQTAICSRSTRRRCSTTSPSTSSSPASSARPRSTSSMRSWIGATAASRLPSAITSSRSTTSSHGTAPASPTTSAARSCSGIRPEDFEDASLESDAPADRRIEAVADLTEPLGSEVLVYFSVEATRDHLQRRDRGRCRGRRRRLLRRRRRGGRPKRDPARRPGQPADADRRRQQDRARRRHEPPLLLRPGDPRGDLAPSP